jgi:hypothetical protein
VIRDVNQMRISLRLRLASAILALLLFPACGKWSPANSADLRTTLEHKKEGGGDRYRFVAPEGKVVESSGKNMSLAANDLLVRKNSEISRYPLDNLQDIEKYQLQPGRTWALILGIVVGTLGVTAAAAFIAAGDDTGS